MEFDYTETSPTSRRPASRPPLSVKEIAALATRFDFNPLIPLRYYLRTADTLLKEVRVSYRQLPTPHP